MTRRFFSYVVLFRSGIFQLSFLAKHIHMIMIIILETGRFVKTSCAIRVIKLGSNTSWLFRIIRPHWRLDGVNEKLWVSAIENHSTGN